jgi:AcrR family transcriptional regulator
MAGVREKKKADKNLRILAAAMTLFRKSGYDNARIEDIAEMAGVSVGTFYNYFETKGDILVATVSMEVEEVLAAGAAIVDGPPNSVADALGTLIAQYFDHSLVYLSKEMWRTAMALATQHPETPFGRRYTELDRRLCAQVSALLRALQVKGVVITDIDAESVGELIFNNLNMMFIEFAKSDTMTVTQLKTTVARQNSPLAVLIEAPASSM